MGKHSVGIVGCGRMGQHYAEVYQTLPDTELLAIAEYSEDRRAAVGERFGVTQLFSNATDMLQSVVPDLVAVVLPAKHIREAVIACARAGVKGVSTDKPIAARLSDADEMVAACQEAEVIFAGGNLQRAMSQVQEAAGWLHAGEFGEPRGASVHSWGGEISGGGCQHISVLRLLTRAEVAEVIAWGKPEEALRSEKDSSLIVNALFRLSNGLECSVFGEQTPKKGVDVWTDTALVSWDWGPPEIFVGFDDSGARSRLDRPYTPLEYPRFSYLATSILSFIAAVEASDPELLHVSGHDLRQALEVAIAAKFSALNGSVPLKLPLEDRSLTLYPGDYRWMGGDESGRAQTVDEALNMQLFPKYKP